MGAGIVTDSQDLAGSDPFGLLLKIHVDFQAATQILTLDVFSDSAGSGFANAPITNNPTLAGQTFYAQCVWAEDAASGNDCSIAQYHLASSTGLAITIQP
ncbi:MAG: hypothetical protein HY286_12050 [Planctomycetes bacterium]|nr:hypothetical protein [Planctomycetota bacterium]